MIRVLHVLGGLNVGGAETMVMNYYRNIDRNKIQFDFIIHTREHQVYYDEIKMLGGIIYSFPKFNGKNIRLVKKNWATFFKNHPEYKIMHSHVRSYASIYLPIAKKYGVKTIIHSHSTSNGRGILSIIKRILQYPIRYQADYFMACSKKAGEWLFGRKVVNSRFFYILKNAINLNQFMFNETIRNDYRAKLNVDSNTIVFVHVGRFHPSKNHTFLINLFYEYNKYNPNSKLLLIGDGELRADIESLISSLCLKESVVLLGNRKDVCNYLQASDCFLFPSKWEGLPVAVIEAQAAGVPCLISNVITKEVSISNLVQCVAIDKGCILWLELLKKMDYSRHNVIDIIKNAGFDIIESAKWLESFYNSIERY
jgi:glycosyltransferase involved in cell wall biosynthesis